MIPKRVVPDPHVPAATGIPERTLRPGPVRWKLRNRLDHGEADLFKQVYPALLLWARAPRTARPHSDGTACFGEDIVSGVLG